MVEFIRSAVIPSARNTNVADDRPVDPSFAAPKRYRGEWVVSADMGRAHVVIRNDGAVLTACGDIIRAWFSVAGRPWDGCSLCVGYAIRQQSSAEKPQPAAGSVDEWLDEWLMSIALARPRSLPFYRQKVAHVRAALGSIQLEALGSRDVRLALAGLAATGLSPSMLRHVFVTLSTALNAAVADSRIPANPCRAIAPPRKSQFEATTLTKEQAQRLLAVARDTRLGPFLTVALSTGMRAGELLALTWDDVDMATGQIRVNKSVQWKAHGEHVAGPTKTRSGRREVRVWGRAVEALAEQRRRTLGTGSDLVFPAVDGGYWIPSGRFVDHFRQLLSEAGCPQVRIHDLRHTAGLFLTRSVGVVVASRVLGHADPSITAKFYGHAQPEDFTAAAHAMSGMLGMVDAPQNAEQ